jgi:hypothetical protein
MRPFRMEPMRYGQGSPSMEHGAAFRITRQIILV